MPDTGQNAWTRALRTELHTKQGGLCFYCRVKIGAQSHEQGKPHLEHYVPKWQGGTWRDCVLACEWCDRAKEMLHGRLFKTIVESCMVNGVLPEIRRQDVSQKAAHWNHVVRSSTPLKKLEMAADARG